MTKLPTPKSEGDKMTCPDCDMPIVARLKTYKDNQYHAYIQWQNEKETKAHKTKDGNCNEGSSTITQNSTVESTTAEEQPLANNDDIAYIKNKVDLMFAMISEQFHDYQKRKSQ